MIWAVKTGHTEMIDLLVKRGADVEQGDTDGNSAIVHALQAVNWKQDMFLDFWQSIKGTNVNINHTNKVILVQKVS